MKRTIQALLSLFLIATMVFSVFGCGVKPVNNPNHGENNNDNTTTTTEKQEDAVPPIKMYTVTFDYNDGSGQKETISVPEGAHISTYAPYPVYGDREVIAWSSMQGGAEYTATVGQDITLYATWQTFEVKIYNDNIPSQINDRNVKLDFSENSVLLSNRMIRIGAGVRNITIVSDGSVSVNTSIMINERVNQLNMTFDNFSFACDQSTALMGEKSTGIYTLNLTIKNNCVIDCSGYIPNAGASGATCIDVPNLKLSGGGTLTLLGGHGRVGDSRQQSASGKDGEDADHGTNGGIGIIANSISVTNLTLNITGGTGGNGGNGGKSHNGLFNATTSGGDAGNAGKGGIAIVTAKFNATNSTLNLSGGAGGIGGHGGDADHGIGLAGRGGNGGNGGDVFGNNISNYSATGCICNYIPGAGGNAGSGGSGVDSSYGNNGHNGVTNVH